MVLKEGMVDETSLIHEFASNDRGNSNHFDTISKLVRYDVDNMLRLFRNYFETSSGLLRDYYETNSELLR
eukprot:7681234-Heterocapsa_arctica.AAC.1